MRTRADNPIAIHHRAGRYTTIAALSLIIFFSLSLPPQPFVFSCSFRNHARHGCLPSSHPAALRCEWLPVGERRRAGCYHLSSAIAADRHCQQNRDALLVFPGRDLSPAEDARRHAHGVLKKNGEKRKKYGAKKGKYHRNRRGIWYLRIFENFVGRNRGDARNTVEFPRLERPRRMTRELRRSPIEFSPYDYASRRRIPRGLLRKCKISRFRETGTAI